MTGAPEKTPKKFWESKKANGHPLTSDGHILAPIIHDGGTHETESIWLRTYVPVIYVSKSQFNAEGLDAYKAKWTSDIKFNFPTIGVQPSHKAVITHEVQNIRHTAFTSDFPDRSTGHHLATFSTIEASDAGGEFPSWHIPVNGQKVVTESVRAGTAGKHSHKYDSCGENNVVSNFISQSSYIQDQGTVEGTKNSVLPWPTVMTNNPIKGKDPLQEWKVRADENSGLDSGGSVSPLNSHINAQQTQSMVKTADLEQTISTQICAHNHPGISEVASQNIIAGDVRSVHHEGKTEFPVTQSLQVTIRTIHKNIETIWGNVTARSVNWSQHTINVDKSQALSQSPDCGTSSMNNATDTRQSFYAEDGDKWHTWKEHMETSQSDQAIESQEQSIVVQNQTNVLQALEEIEEEGDENDDFEQQD